VTVFEINTNTPSNRQQEEIEVDKANKMAVTKRRTLTTETPLKQWKE
jgi:hypothetical protein